MFVMLARKYLIWSMKKKGIDTLELVIRDDGWTMRKRNFKREESIKETLSKIK